jgi:3-oxoacyl-[acyl-carrier protein] reductase
MAIQDLILRRKSVTVDDKVVFITGGSLGIGKETCLIFARRGWSVAFSYFKDKKEGLEVEKKCKELGASDVLSVYLDVRESASIKKAVKEIFERYNKIDVLINNAGVVEWKELLDQEDEEIENQVRTNLEGLIKVTRYCIPYIKDVIINVSSGAGMTGYAEMTTYCATKFGVRGFTQALAEELDKIKVYSVNPGSTKTRMTGFKGIEPNKVGEIIYNTAIGKYKVRSGGDVNVWNHL